MVAFAKSRGLRGSLTRLGRRFSRRGVLQRAVAEALESRVFLSAAPPVTTWWSDTRYLTQAVSSGKLLESFVAEERIGNNALNGTFEYDIGKTTSAPAQSQQFVWAQNALPFSSSSTGQNFSFTYSASTQVATFTNAGTSIQYTVPTSDWNASPNLDAIFIRLFSSKSTAGLRLANLQLTTTALGSAPINITNPNGSDPSVVEVAGNSTGSLQISGADLHHGFTLTGTSYWAWSSSDRPSNSNLAFQIKVGTFIPPTQNPCPTCPPSLVRDNIQNGGTGGEKTADGVGANDGVVYLTSTDLFSSASNIYWGVVRGWTNKSAFDLGSGSGGGNATGTTGGMGTGAFSTMLPYLLHAGGTSGRDTMIVVNKGNDTRFFDLGGSTYAPRNYAKDKLAYDNGTDTFAMTDAVGDTLVFYGFGSGVPEAQQGALKSYASKEGGALTLTYNSNGTVQEVKYQASKGTATAITSYLYAYGTNGAVSGVTLRQKTFDTALGQTETGTSYQTVRSVAYAYYSDGDSGGSGGDLKTAIVKDAGGNTIGTSYYRYYTATGSTGYKHGLKYALSADSYARLAAAVSNVDTASDATVAAYADHYFEYDRQHKVTAHKVLASGSSAGGGVGNYSIATTYSSNTDAPNSWHAKTIETRPDGNVTISYTNYMGQVMLTAQQDSSGNQWVTYHKYDSVGREVLTAEPSAFQLYSGHYYSESLTDLIGVTTGNSPYLVDSGGLLELTDYYSGTTATETTAGGADGFIADTKVQHGETGTPILQASYTYYARTAGGTTVYNIASETRYRNTDGTGGQTTSYGYSYFSGSLVPQQIITTLPVVTTAQNGSGIADVDTDVYDQNGQLIWSKDADGFLTYNAYDLATGALVKSIRDVDTTRTSEFTDLPSGWSTPAGGGLHLVTTYQVDSQGRTVATTDPKGNVTWTVYNDAAQETRTYRGWNASTHQPTGPVQVMRYDQAGSYSENLAIIWGGALAYDTTTGAPLGTESLASGTLLSLSRTHTTAGGQTDESDSYFNLSGVSYSASTFHLGTQATAGTGWAGNYYATLYGYDAAGRQNRVVSPTGTISRTVFDSLDRTVSSWVGTNDTGATDADPTGGGATGNNMVKVSDVVYDNGGVGDSNLTQSTQYPGGSQAARVTRYVYDWRNRSITSKSGVQATETDNVHRPLTVSVLDNLGQAIASYGFDGDGISLADSNADGVPDALDANADGLPDVLGALRTYGTGSYDEQGRTYRTAVYSVDPGTGTISSNALTSDMWFDRRGNQVKAVSPGGPVSKAAFDGVGRASVSYITDGGGDSSWADALTVDGDVVLIQTENTYDANSNVILTTLRQRFHDATGTGALGTPSSTGQPKARVSYMASYYDSLDRMTAGVDVGTNGGSSYTRPGSVPSRAAAILVTSYTYNDQGLTDTVTDPRGIVGKNYYDALGRTTETIAAWDGTMVGVPTDSTNQTTRYTYDGAGHTLTMTADMPTGQNDQTTQYVYGVDGSTGSVVASNDLLRLVEYPDKTTGATSTSASDQNSFTYDALGEALSKTDQNGTVHSYGFDVLGRQTSDAVTVASGNPQNVNTRILRIGTNYNTQGNVFQVTSYDATSGGNIVNQIQYAYNGLGQLITEYQEHDGAVNTSTSPKVQYAYSEMAGGANHSRPTSMTYPNGKVLTYSYGTSGSLNDTISRLAAMAESAGTLESYQYLGLSTVVVRSHPQAGVDLTYVQQTGDTSAITDGGDQYTGLDRFGRVIDQNWLLGSGSADRFQYGYDENGNRLYKNNLVDASQSELYHASGSGNGYDSLNRLTGFARGALSASTTGGPLDTVASAVRTQGWSLDALGNTDITTNSVTDDRTFNSQNQITSLTYDANGNTLTDTTGRQLVYDAWNRLVLVKDSGGAALRSYAYDGTGRRITESDVPAVRINITGTSGNDTIQVTASGSSLIISLNSTVIRTVPVGTVLELTIDGAFGSDTLNISAGTVHLLSYTNGTLDVNVSNSGTVLELYSFDNINSLNNGAGSTVNFAGVNSTIMTDLYYSSQWQVIEERLGDNTDVEAQYVWSPVYVDALILRDKDTSDDQIFQTTERVYALQDANFNTTALVAYDTGTSTWGVGERYLYDPYGAVTVTDAGYSPRSGNVSAYFGFNYLHQGGRYDQAADLYDFRERPYSPTLQRWLTQDPMGYVDGGNVYLAYKDSPVSYVDPEGLYVNAAIQGKNVVFEAGIVLWSSGMPESYWIKTDKGLRPGTRFNWAAARRYMDGIRNAIPVGLARLQRTNPYVVCELKTGREYPIKWTAKVDISRDTHYINKPGNWHYVEVKPNPAILGIAGPENGFSPSISTHNNQGGWGVWSYTMGDNGGEPWWATHEILHFAGLWDKYSWITGDPDPGWQDNIMGGSKKGVSYKLTQWQIETMLKDRLKESQGWTLGTDYIVLSQHWAY